MGRIFGTHDYEKNGNFMKLQDSCKWQFEFQLKTNERSFVLRCANRQDRDHWVRVFNLIVSMNAKRLTSDKLNPFTFEAQEKNKQRIMVRYDDEISNQTEDYDS